MIEPDRAWSSLQFLVATQQHIHENIKFADQKASQIITLNTALIAALYTIAIASDRRYVLGALAAWALLAVGIFFAVSVVRPRGEQNERRGPGLLDAIRIVQLKPDAFLDGFSSASTDRLTREMHEFIYDRACIDRDKYNELRRSLLYSGAGWAASLLTAGVTIL